MRILHRLFSKTERQVVVFGSVMLLLRWLSGQRPDWVEAAYSRGLYPAIRRVLDFVTGILPFPLLYIVVVVAIGLITQKILQWWRWSAPLPKKLLSVLGFVIAFLLGLGGVFLISWGFNYGRIPIEVQQGWTLTPRTAESLWAELATETDTLIMLRAQLSADSSRAITAQDLPDDLEQQVRTALQHQLTKLGYPSAARVRGRFVYPKGIYLRFSSSGMYFPFSGEGTLDAGLHPLQWPYVMTHEMAHGYGFGDEGSCNFWAWLATRDHSDPAIRYAGRLSYWRTLAVNCLHYDRERYQRFREQLPPGIIADLSAINYTLNRYPDLMPEFRYKAYNAYLQSQGISEGIENYNRILMLAEAWRQHQ